MDKKCFAILVKSNNSKNYKYTGECIFERLCKKLKLYGLEKMVAMPNHPLFQNECVGTMMAYNLIFKDVEVGRIDINCVENFRTVIKDIKAVFSELVDYELIAIEGNVHSYILCKDNIKSL